MNFDRFGGARKFARAIVALGGFCAASFAVVALGATPARADTCSNLKDTFSMPNTTITSTESIAAGTFNLQSAFPRTPLETPVPPVTGIPAFCRVIAVLTPTSDSKIGIEVWLPTSGWNGKLESIANHLQGGAYYYTDMDAALKRNYAVASTDTGHKDTEANWALGHPEKMADFSWRAVHEMTVAAKAIITAYYGVKPRYSYYNGCSTGGMQTLKEAQRFPDDYDGILSGSGFHYQTHLPFASAWKTQVMLKDGVNGASYLPPSKYNLVVNAAMDHCKSLKQVPTDNFLGNPTRCDWDPKTLVCNAGQDANTCITGAQADALEKIYEPLRNPRTHEEIYPGATRVTVPNWAEGAVRQATDPNSHTADAAKLNFDSDVALADEKDANGPRLNAVNPDLSGFKRHGGKLIEYQGWFDWNLAPYSVEHYESVVATIGEQDHDKNDNDALKDTQGFYRLFVAPGMAHCWGGPGPNAFGALGHTAVPDDPQHNLFDALEQWVEHGAAPTQVIGTKYVKDDPKQGIAMQRPICPYPQEAHYKGSGGTAYAANFVCANATRNLKPSVGR